MSDKENKEPQNISEPNNEAIDQNFFDPAKLRLSQNFSESVDVRKVLTTVPVHKPNRQDFVRVREGAEWRLETPVLEVKDEGETYLVDPALWSELPGETVPKALFTTINRQGVLSIWPIRLPNEDGRLDQWNRSALDAAERAQTTWIRVAANRSLGAYEVFEAMAKLPEPDWPEADLKTILERAFRDHFIRDHDHPVLKRLRGEA